MTVKDQALLSNDFHVLLVAFHTVGVGMYTQYFEITAVFNPDKGWCV